MRETKVKCVQGEVCLGKVYVGSVEKTCVYVVREEEGGGKRREAEALFMNAAEVVMPRAETLMNRGKERSEGCVSRF